MRLFSLKPLYQFFWSGFIWLMVMNNSFAVDDFEQARQDMVTGIKQMMSVTKSYTGQSVLDEPVTQAMLSVPRHKFVSADMQRYAYANRALPIQHKQTISQPYIVALMTDLAEVSSDSVVLEVGTGSGYQAAVLAEIVQHVYSIEIVEPLGLTAKTRLQDLGYSNVTVKIGDGYYGWPEYAPFDAILVTAAAPEVPKALLQQLKPGGRLVIPVGPQGKEQSLQVLLKNADGGIQQQDIIPVAFVPLTGER